MNSQSERTRAKLRELLTMAERHIAEGEARIAKRRQRLSELERNRSDLTVARAEVHQHEELQKLHLADRDRLAQLLMLDGPGLEHPLAPESGDTALTLPLRAATEQIERVIADLQIPRRD